MLLSKKKPAQFKEKFKGVERSRIIIKGKWKRERRKGDL
jgi:hypothetical protein